MNLLRDRRVVWLISLLGFLGGFLAVRVGDSISVILGISFIATSALYLYARISTGVSRAEATASLEFFALLPGLGGVVSTALSGFSSYTQVLASLTILVVGIIYVAVAEVIR